jgi:hypothetical protein
MSGKNFYHALIAATTLAPSEGGFCSRKSLAVIFRSDWRSAGLLQAQTIELAILKRREEGVIS